MSADVICRKLSKRERETAKIVRKKKDVRGKIKEKWIA
jgi:hypothetical protein